MRFRKLLLLPVCAFLFASCGETQSDDEMQSDAGFKEGIYIKEGTYQKKDSKEKILIIDQSHLQLSDMDFQALIDHYKITYSDFGWKPDENTINEIQEPRNYESYEVGNEKNISMELFENWESFPVIEYYDNDGYSLVYKQEEYFLIDDEK